MVTAANATEDTKKVNANGQSVRGSAKASLALRESTLIDVSKIDGSNELNTSRFDIDTTSEEFKDLTEDIALRGLDHPLDLRKRPDGSYALINGFRRFTAIRILGWEQVPCRVSTITSDYDAAARNVADNVGRKDLTSAEQVTAAVRLRDLAKKEGIKVTGEDLGKKIGKSGKHTSNLLRVHDVLEPSLGRALMAGELGLTRAIALAGMSEKERAETPEGKKAGLSGGADSGSEGTGTPGTDNKPKKPETAKREAIEKARDMMAKAISIKLVEGGKRTPHKLTDRDKKVLLGFIDFLLKPKTEKKKDRNPFEYPAEKVEEAADDDDE